MTSKESTESLNEDTILETTIERPPLSASSSVSEMTEMVQRLSSKIVDKSCSWGSNDDDKDNKDVKENTARKTNTDDKEAGIVHYKFSRNDVLKAIQHWQDDDNSDDDYDSSDELYRSQKAIHNDLILPSQRYKAYLNNSKYLDNKYYNEDDLILMQAQIEAAKKKLHYERLKKQENAGPGITKRAMDFAKSLFTMSNSPPASPKIMESPKSINMEERQNVNDDLITSITIQAEDTNPFILSQSLMLQIAQQGLPTSVAFAQWKRLYSLVRDGDSFSTMLRKVQNHKQTLLVIKTTNEDIFGGYADSPWEAQHQHAVGHAFYGSAQAFLFSITDQIHIYKWTGKNRYIQFCDVQHKLIAMGGGGEGGSFGLCIEDDFRRGSTGRCDTFDNDCLIADSESNDARFNVLDLEVWGFIPGF